MSRRKAPEISLHPAPEDLMSFLDGELEDHETASVRRHLERCTACTRTLQQFAAVSSRFSSETLAAGMGPVDPQPAFAPSPAARPQPRVPAHPETGRARPTARWAFTLPRSAAASIAILLVGTLVAHLLLSPRPVSARGLVDTARQHQQEFWQTHPAQALQRNLRVTITVSGKAVATEHWASHLNPRASHEELVSAGEIASEIQNALPHVACRMFVPLSLEMLDCLLDAEPASVHVLERESEGGAPRFVIEIASLQPNFSPLESRWTLRSEDWHLGMVEYRIVRDQREMVYRIEEESAALVPLPPPPIELSRVEPQPTLPARVPALPLQNSSSPDASQPGIRLRVFEAIDTFEPALDEDLQFEEETGGGTTVSGIVPRADRKAQLESLLAAHTGARSSVLTQSEAIAAALAALGPQSTSHPAPRNDREVPVIPPGDAIRSQDPLLAPVLAERFGSDEDGNALALRFGAAVLEDTQHLAFRARWLERLENAFSVQDWQAMPAVERERFLALRAKWRASLRDRHQSLRQRVAAMICPSPCPDPGTTAAPSADSAERPDSLPAEIPRWKSALDAEIALLKTMFVDGAFAPAGSAEQAKSHWRQTSLATSQALESPQPWPPPNTLAARTAAQAP